MKKFLSIFFLSILLSQTAFAAIVEIVCTVKPVGEEYNAFIKKLEKDTSTQAASLKVMLNPRQWWQFWADDSYKLSFSVDEDTSQVLFPPWHTIEIFPESIVIREYFMGPCGKKAECEALSYEYHITRPDGRLSGVHFAADDSWKPYFKLGDEMWSVKGNCDTMNVRR